MRPLLTLLFLTACNPSTTGTRHQDVEATPEEMAAFEKRQKEKEAAREAELRAGQVAVAPKVNANTATREELLAAVEDLGDKMAHEIEEYRPYTSIQVFRKELGKYVVPEYIVFYERFLYVPINYNECDGPTLAQFPGLTEDEAAALIAGRPYATREAFIAKLSEYTDEEDREIGLPYLTGP